MTVEFRPNVLQFVNGEMVKNAKDWPARRMELLEILQREEYGYMPEAPKEVRAEEIERIEKCASGHAHIEKIKLSFDTPKGEFSFPVLFYLIVFVVIMTTGLLLRKQRRKEQEN